MGLGIDVAQSLVERRDAQGAADLAALAGARHLDDEVSYTDQTDARAAAVAVAVANGYSASEVTATTPYGGDVSKIRISIDSSVSTYFLPVLDLILPGDHTTINVDAHAVAYGGYEAGGEGGFAVLALEGCPSSQKSAEISGSTTHYVGRVHSNSDLYISGSTNDFDGTTSAVCGSGYPAFHNGGGGNAFDPAYAVGTAEPDPLALLRADFTCDFLAPSTGAWDLATNGSWWVGGTKSSKTLRAGTYCSRGSSGSIKLSDSDIVIQDVVSGPGGVTFLAQTQIEDLRLQLQSPPPRARCALLLRGHVRRRPQALRQRRDVVGLHLRAERDRRGVGQQQPHDGRRDHRQAREAQRQQHEHHRLRPRKWAGRPEDRARRVARDRPTARASGPPFGGGVRSR